MSAAEKPLAAWPPIPIEVTLNRDRIPVEAGSPWDSTFHSRLNRRARELAEDLGIAAELVVRLSWTEASRSGESPTCEIAVDGSACRVDRTLEIPGRHDAEELAERVAEELYWNRSLLLTEAVIEHCHERRRKSRHAERITLEQLGRWLRQLVSRGLSIPMSFEVLDEWAAGEQCGFVPDYACEMMLADRFPKAVTVEAGCDQYDVLCGGGPGGTEEPPASLAGVRDSLFDELGVKFPPVQRIDLSEELDPGRFRIRVGSIAGPVHTGLGQAEVLVGAMVESLGLLGLEARPASHPVSGAANAVVAEEDAWICQNAGLATWDPAGYIGLVLSRELRRQAALFLIMPQVEHLLGRLNERFPMPVFNVLERYGMVEVQRVLQSLAEEGVSVRDLRAVLEALLEIDGVIDVEDVGDELITAAGVHLTPRAGGAAGVATADRVEYVRAALRWHLTHRHGGGEREIAVIRLTAETERRLLQSVDSPLTQAERQRLHNTVAREWHKASDLTPRPPVLASTPVRRRFYELVFREFPGLTVMGSEEVAPGRREKPVGWIDALHPLPGS